MSEHEEHWLSYSQLAKYRKCRWAWWAHYHRCIRLRGAADDRLEIGTLVHAGLEAALRVHHAYAGANMVDLMGAASNGVAIYVKERSRDERNEDVIAQINDLAVTCGEIASRAVRWLDLPRWEVVTDHQGRPLIEATLASPTPISDFWAGMLGRVDAVLRERSTGAVYVFDFKTRAAFQDYSGEETAEQLAIYQALLLTSGIESSGVITFQIRSSMPEWPEVTKKGELSRKRISTDWETYKAAIEMAGFDPADYEDVKAWASEKEFFRLTRNYRGEAETAAIVKEIGAVAEEMCYVTKHAPRSIYRNLSPGALGACKTCDLRDLCLADLRGHDTTWLLRTKYRHKDEPNVHIRPEDVDFTE